MLKAAFTIFGAFNSIKTIMVVGVLGISIVAASVIMTIFSVTKFVFKITRNNGFHR